MVHHQRSVSEEIMYSREEYVHFEVVNGMLQFQKENCPQCGESLRGQFDTTYWNWISVTREKLISLARKQDLRCWALLLACIAAASIAPMLLYILGFSDFAPKDGGTVGNAKMSPNALD